MKIVKKLGILLITLMLVRGSSSTRSAVNPTRAEETANTENYQPLEQTQRVICKLTYL